MMRLDKDHFDKARQKLKRHGFDKASQVVRNLESDAFGRGDDQKAEFWLRVGDAIDRVYDQNPEAYRD